MAIATSVSLEKNSCTRSRGTVWLPVLIVSPPSTAPAVSAETSRDWTFPVVPGGMASFRTSHASRITVSPGSRLSTRMVPWISVPTRVELTKETVASVSPPAAAGSAESMNAA